jgi:GMP synthase (glutamine-hydrolysing)
MKKKILVIQFRTDKSLQHERDCIVQAGDWDISQLVFINMLNPDVPINILENINSYGGIILGGSGEVNISDWEEEKKKLILRIEPIIKQAIDADLPMLGICFGHQLISYVLGGSIKADPKQAETGTFEMMLNNEGVNSQLFRNLPKTFCAVEGHKDSVVTLPEEAVLLASSKKCGIEAYRIKNNIYGIQFHPELDREGMRCRLNLFPGYAKNGIIDEIMRDYQPTPDALKVISNYKDICD